MWLVIGRESDDRSRGREFDIVSWRLIMNNFHDHSTPSPDSRRVDGSYKRKYVHEVTVNHLVKLAQKKVWLHVGD